ncbi:hypothetical protein BOX15_Mlig025838g1, partial [Macrostomum lignano]
KRTKMHSSDSLPEYSFRASSDKSLPNHRIRLMRASPRMDLLLLAADNGDVLLFRWGWERVWLVNRPRDLPAPPPEQAAENAGESCCSPVTCIDWRPDGQVALVAYSDGRLRHLSLEDGSVLHEDWLTRRQDQRAGDSANEGPALCSHWALLANRQFTEPWTRAGEALPVFADLLGGASSGASSSSSTSTTGGGGVVDWTASRRIERQLSLLAVASRLWIHLLAYGICRLCRLSLDQLCPGAWCPEQYRPVSVLVSDNLARVSLLASREGRQQAVLQFDTGLAEAGRYERVRRVALTVVQLTQLTAGLRRCLKEMTECWEDSVHELDQKFADYSKDRDEYALAMGEPEWQLRTDLMALLLTGHCHAKFREFLCEGLSRAGLVRIGRGIETSLCSVQRHNACQLQTLLFALIFHLAELADCAATGVADLGKGDDEVDEEGGESGDEGEDDLGERRLEAEASDDDGELAETGNGDAQLGELSRRRAADALTYAGSALAKSLELGSVIERTRDSLRAFCEWLYVQILRLSKEAVPRALQRTTVQRRRLVIDFIRHQLADGAATGGQRRFRLELVGQYLADEPLASVPDCPTVWQQVLERHLQREAWTSGHRRQRRLLRACTLVRPDTEASLAQCLERLCDRVDAACRLVEPRRVRLLTEPPVQPVSGLRPLAQGFIGRQALYHALLLHPDGCTGLLFRQGPDGWCGLRFRCSSDSDGALKLVDACQLDAKQFACLLAGPEGASATSSLVVLPLAAFNEADWSPPTASPESAAAGLNDSSIVELADRLGERLRADNLPGCGIAVAAERRLMVSVLFACHRRLRVCLLEPFSEDDDDDEEGGAADDADRDEEDHVANVSAMSATAPMEQN